MGGVLVIPWFRMVPSSKSTPREADESHAPFRPACRCGSRVRHRQYGPVFHSGGDRLTPDVFLGPLRLRPPSESELALRKLGERIKGGFTKIFRDENGEDCPEEMIKKYQEDVRKDIG